MPIRHQIADSDTVEYLALKYFGDPERWRDIVNYNNLVYPYISSDPDDRKLVYAHGYVTVTRQTANFPLTIEKYWTLSTKRNVMSSATKTYEVVSDVTMGIGVTQAYLFVRSIVPGLQGNTPNDSITVLGNDFIVNGVNVIVTNEKPITNGGEGFVRTTGEYIYLPSDEENTVLQNHGVGFSYDEMQYFYGTDLAMDINDDLVFDAMAGHLRTVNYLDNVVQAINRRLCTEKGDVLSDFTFGNRVLDIIGDYKLPYEAQKKLIQVAILETLNYEDRISDPIIKSIEFVPLELACYVDITVKVVNLGTTLDLQKLRLGGTTNVSTGQ